MLQLIDEVANYRGFLTSISHTENPLQVRVHCVLLKICLRIQGYILLKQINYTGHDLPEVQVKFTIYLPENKHILYIYKKRNSIFIHEYEHVNLFTGIEKYSTTYVYRNRNMYECICNNLPELKVYRQYLTLSTYLPEQKQIMILRSIVYNYTFSNTLYEENNTLFS